MAMKTRMRAGAAVVIAIALAGCGTYGTRYYIGAFEGNQELRELFNLLDREGDDKNRFVLIQQIGTTLAAEGKADKEIIFLTTHAEKNPSDIYNGYYLLMVADAYREMKAVPFAIHYYRRILENHVDLLVDGQSIHLHCLLELIDLETDPEHKIEYYKELISRFGGSPEVHPGQVYYMLARAYEEVGEWEQAIVTYQQFIKFLNTDVPGVPDAYIRAQERVLFYYSNRNWTVPDRDRLVDAVKDAIGTKNFVKLRTYQAKVNFFARGWDQQAVSGDPSDDAMEDMSADSYIGLYLVSSAVRVDGGLDINSNDSEAFLRTTGWNFRPSTWYLYFRKVDFPSDPEVNGQWEWAGIYFGERL
jgi:tetratricopeptide (TPR) repeat protein